MKKYGKIICLLILTFMFTLNVKAITITTNSTTGTVDTNSKLVTNTGEFKVTGVNTGDTFKAYKILDVFYNSSQNTITYEFTSSFKAFLASTGGQTPDRSSLTVANYQALTGGSITSGNVKQNNGLDELMSAYAAYIKTNNVTGTNMPVTTSNNVSSAKATVQAGSYLALPTSTNSVYAVMAGNVELTGNNNVWTLNPVNITAKVSNPNLTKVLTSNNTTEDSFNIGEEHTFKITANIPTYPANARNKTLIITDTLDNTLEFKGLSSVVIKDGTTNLTINTSTGKINKSSNEVGTITFSNNVLTITLSADKLASTQIPVEYVAKLKSNAVLGSAGNKNTAKLTYSNDPYVTGNSGTTDTPTVSTKSKTYGIKIKKVDGNNAPLNGAVFTLYSNSACTTQVKVFPATGTDGYTKLEGLKKGTYYYKETTSPAGYRANNTCYSVAINETKDYTEPSSPVTNVKMGLLPSTGGIGTYIYIAFGSILILVSLLLVYYFSKKERKNII
jgi:fimbrial isopeptide formation D2 family protein/LPXTG-motif cell wall-anchored protein